MSESFYDAIAMICIVVVPVLLILLHIFLSSRKKLFWGFIIPVIWLICGIYMVIKAVSFPVELGIFFGIIFLILIAILCSIRICKKKNAGYMSIGKK